MFTDQFRAVRAATAQTAFDFLDASTRGIWRVWRDSYKKWLLVPQPRRQLRCYYREAQRFNMSTRGALGGSAMRVLYELIEHFADPVTGELTPSKQQLADRLGLCVRTVANALDRLKAFGIISWVRRCLDDRDAHGRYQLRQISNAYAIKSPASWRWSLAPKIPLRPKAELIADAVAATLRSPSMPQQSPSWTDTVAHYQAHPSRLAALLKGN